MLTDTQRATYSALADVLIPEAEGMPSASQADVPTVWIDKALEYRPDLRDAFVKALETCEGQDPANALEWLNKNDTPTFDALGVLTSGSYFLNPEIKERIGYPGQQPVPAKDDSDTYLDLLSVVVERGPIFRPTVG